MLSCNKDKNNPGYDYMGFQDMYYTKYNKAYSPSMVFRDSITNQLPVKGAIARGHMPFPFEANSIGERALGQMQAGEVIINPLTPNEENLAKGKELFTTFCLNCHGAQGKGDGYLYTSKLFPAKPTSLVDAYLKNKKDGEIYFVITKGSISGLMGAHGSQVTPDERWMIINYIRTLAQ